jgi:hypothetical protein
MNLYTRERERRKRKRYNQLEEKRGKRERTLKEMIVKREVISHNLYDL